MVGTVAQVPPASALSSTLGVVHVVPLYVQLSRPVWNELSKSQGNSSGTLPVYVR